MRLYKCRIKPDPLNPGVHTNYLPWKPGHMTSWYQKNPYTLHWCQKDAMERDTDPKHVTFGVKKWLQT
jgi:hypothetical protein